jgi:hypothetical protein
MHIAIGSNPIRPYLASMESRSVGDQTEMLDSLMSQLNDDQRQSIIDYASFLAHQSKTGVVDRVDALPNLIDRPPLETVAEAIDRLKRSYFMLDTDDLLNDVAALMSKHVLQGLEARVVIDELQLCFQSYYRKTKNND